MSDIRIGEQQLVLFAKTIVNSQQGLATIRDKLAVSLSEGNHVYNNSIKSNDFRFYNIAQQGEPSLVLSNDELNVLKIIGGEYQEIAKLLKLNVFFDSGNIVSSYEMSRKLQPDELSFVCKQIEICNVFDLISHLKIEEELGVSGFYFSPDKGTYNVLSYMSLHYDSNVLLLASRIELFETLKDYYELEYLVTSIFLSKGIKTIEVQYLKGMAFPISKMVVHNGYNVIVHYNGIALVSNSSICILFLWLLLGFLLIKRRVYFERILSDLRLDVSDGEIDSLTGLSNRDAFEKFRAYIHRNDREHKLVVIIFDGDGIKAINDKFGHRVGDQAIISLAKAIKSNARKTDQVFRTGGDEFVAILDDIDDEKVVEKIINKIRDSVSSSGFIDLDVSFGYCKYISNSRVNFDDVFETADRKMYENKMSK